MEKKELLALGLTEEQADKILAANAGEVTAAKGALTAKEGELATATQTIADLQGTVKKFDGVDVEGLKKSLVNLQTKYDSDIASAKLDSALNLALVAAKAKNPKLAKAALDLSTVKLDGDKLLGLDDQLAKLKESDGYLFDGGTPAATVDSGGAHTSGGATDYSKMSDDDYYAATMKKKE